MNHLADLTLANLLPTASRTATTKGADQSLKAGAGMVGFILDSAIPSAGAAPTWAVKIQTSDIAVGSVNVTTDPSVAIGLRIGATDNIKLAAYWTQSGARSIKYVYLKLKRVGTIGGTDTITLNLYANTGTYAPTGSTLGTATVVVPSTLGTEWEWVKFTFSTPVELSDATVYHAELTGGYTQSASNYVALGVVTVASGGNLNIFDSSYGGTVSTQQVCMKIEQYNFADATGGAFSAVSDAAVQEALVLNSKLLGTHVRAVGTIGGTDTPTVTSCVNMVYVPQYRD